jgi:1,2-dihydroxy-3-keto-5-methylthiopentene dioxygenase
MYEQWPLNETLGMDAPDSELLAFYQPRLAVLMAKFGCRMVDLISVTEQTPNLPAIRDKFLREHTHTEDEVRMFVRGEGLFWFHLERPEEEVFAVLCQQGDVIAVPANTRHWFELGPHPSVRAIRIFTDQSGWVPHYTDSGIEQRYQDTAWRYAVC